MAVTTVEASIATPQRSVIHRSHGHSRPAATKHPFLDRFCGVFSAGKKSSPSPSPSTGEKSRHGGLVHLPADKAPPLLVTKAEYPREGGGEYYCLGRVFQYLDEDGDGKISPSELRSCMRTVGEELSEEDAEEVVGSTDSDGDGLLGFEDFVRLVEVEGEEERTRDLRVAFGMYAAAEGRRHEAVEGGGCCTDACITPKSLRRMLAKLGEWKSLDECRVMIQSFDLNGDGVLSFDEFRVMML
ncbi:hypothetical protein Taro_025336 [Colocasia esculenta]|uniref:EF-hand domain-containing protein n=1 Tax=Colocasia esculenta TaxID=4460 RepID=A0A843VBY0_COLES|nr:hypothetical protein [Colocasia esculenta]